MAHGQGARFPVLRDVRFFHLPRPSVKLDISEYFGQFRLKNKRKK
jgi:hypothetical protein